MPPCSVAGMAGARAEDAPACDSRPAQHCQQTHGLPGACPCCPPQVTGFKCRQCNTVSEKRHPECRDHDVVRVNTTKRWWTCCECSAHFSTVSVTYPTKPCPK
jgi:hypothetical protein